MQREKSKLLAELLRKTENTTAAAKKLKTLHNSQLHFKPTEDAWSILQCIEHLNLYGDFYLPEMEKQLLTGNHTGATTLFKSGLIGNYFANLMKVKNGNLKKMKALKDKMPAASGLSVTTIDRFLKQQELLKNLLAQAQHADLTKTKTAISLTRFIRLRLGDTLRFFVYHIERHMLQAEKLAQQVVACQHHLTQAETA